MPEDGRRREVGRGERVLPGIWRLRLPLPFDGVPHCNAWALASGDGIVLVDCGGHAPGSIGHLERALAQCNLRLEHVRLLVITHAHSDHYGMAETVVERAGCALWMHHDHRHLLDFLDFQGRIDARAGTLRRAGTPESEVRAWVATMRSGGSSIAGYVPPDRNLSAGDEIHSDLGPWTVVETPGHAPSHVCLHQPGRRLLISGDHLMGQVAPYYEWGYTPDPAGEFLDSLTRIEDCGARLCLSGHGRTFTDVQGHIDANRAFVRDRLAVTLAFVREAERATAYGLATRLSDGPPSTTAVYYRVSDALAYLRHLEVTGGIGFAAGVDGPDRWLAKP